MKLINKKNMQQFVLFGILTALVIFFSICSENFFTAVNITNLIRQQSIVAIIAAGGTLVMITKGLDISVGSTVALSGVVFALSLQAGMPMWLGLILGMLSGGLVGCINATTIVGLGINPTIATLGTMEAIRGVAYLLADGKAVVNGLPANFNFLGRGYVGAVPIPVLIMIVVFVLSHFILSKTLIGKYIYAIGGNIETARYAGIQVKKVLVSVYIYVGLLAGLSGVLLASRLTSGNPQIGSGYEFDVIIAVYLGGVSTKGGEGSVIGTLIGAMIVGVLTNGMNILGINSFYQYIVRGAVLVIAVVIDMIIKEGKFKLKKVS